MVYLTTDGNSLKC